MKKQFVSIFILLLISVHGKSQFLEGQVGMGSGFMNLVEHFERSPSNFSLPFSYSIGLSMAENDSSVALVVLYNHFEYLLGSNFFLSRPLVKMRSFQLGVEQINRRNKTAIGYRAMTGFGVERNNPFSDDESFICISAAMLISQRITEKLRFEAQPGLFWADVANTFRGSDNWTSGGEDVSLCFTVGLRYKFLH